MHRFISQIPVFIRNREICTFLRPGTDPCTKNSGNWRLIPGLHVVVNLISGHRAGVVILWIIHHQNTYNETYHSFCDSAPECFATQIPVTFFFRRLKNRSGERPDLYPGAGLQRRGLERCGGSFFKRTYLLCPDPAWLRGPATRLR